MTPRTMTPERIARLNFERHLPLLWELEGGYANHPKDPGGATKYGVTQLTYDAYRRSRGLEPRTVRHLSQAEAADIYERDYWPAGGKQCAGFGKHRLAGVVFDWGVNGGPSRARRYLQAALNLVTSPPLVVDGIIGPKTLAAIEQLEDEDERWVCERFLELRVDHHGLRADLEDADLRRERLEKAGITGRFLAAPLRSQRVFLRTWWDRCRRVGADAGVVVRDPSTRSIVSATYASAAIKATEKIEQMRLA